MRNVPFAEPAPARRWRLSGGARLIAGTVATMVIGTVLVVAFAWPSGSDVDAPHQWIDAGAVDEFEVNEPIRNVEGRFYVVKLESGEILALYKKDPHLGCSIPWAADFEFIGQIGWFRNPCHSETYTITGHCVFGPCRRGMDRFTVDVRNDRVLVDVESLIEGPPLGEEYLGATPNANRR